MANVEGITLQEVARHQSRSDCWLVINGGVYDVTHWMLHGGFVTTFGKRRAPQHPGGDVIYTNAGKDATALFESYHGPSARRVLQKYYIGPLQRQPGDANDIVDFDHGDDEFYAIVKQRVRQYFRNNNLNPRVSSELYIKSAIILAGLISTYYLTFFTTLPILYAFLLALLLGFFKGEVGVSIQHDANHGAFSTRRCVSTIMGITLDAVGASSFYWQQQHVNGHHSYTNVVGQDPDIRVSDKDIRRVAHSHPLHKQHKKQHLYLGFLYGLLTLKSIFVDDFISLFTGHIGAVKVKRMDLREHAVFWAGKLFYLLFFMVVPLRYGAHSPAQSAALWLTCELITGYMLAFMFQVAHVVEDIAFYKQDNKGQVSMPWSEEQLRTTADFSHGNWWWLHISGGLNYQVVHHLFPGVAHPHYPQLAPIVKQTAEEYGLPYIAYGSFGEAVSKHFKHLKHMGADAWVPSLRSIG